MRFVHPLIIAIFLLAAGCGKRQGEEPRPVVRGEPPAAPSYTEADARKVVEKAIEAHGGAEAVAKLRSMRIKAVGTAARAPGQPMTAITIEDIWQMPDKYKTTLTLTLNGKEVRQTQVIDGDKGWAMVNGLVQDLPKADLTEMKEQRYAEDFDRLDFLQRPEITLSLTDSAVMSEPVSVVTIHSPGHRDVALSFSKTTGLLIKREHPVLDSATGTEIKQEVIFAYFARQDGVMHYRKIMAYRNGKQVVDAKVTEIEFLPKIDDKVFAKP